VHQGVSQSTPSIEQAALVDFVKPLRVLRGKNLGGKNRKTKRGTGIKPIPRQDILTKQ
jgi:hypothetical protein